MGTGWTSNIETAGGSQRQPSMASPASTCSVAVSSPHFEPYPIPSTVHAAHSSLPSDYQLRKVNSEPNLKMRIRAKLLSKGSSPVQTHQNSAFSFAQHRSLQRWDFTIVFLFSPFIIWYIFRVIYSDQNIHLVLSSTLTFCLDG